MIRAARTGDSWVCGRCRRWRSTNLGRACHDVGVNYANAIRHLVEAAEAAGVRLRMPGARRLLGARLAPGPQGLRHYPEHHLWRAAEAVREIEDALVELRDR